MHVLDAPIRDYAWGSTDLLAELQGRTPTGRPEAEMWLGAHPGAPSLAEVDGRAIGLDELISSDPDRHLGQAARFGRLPFLMKLLAAGEPLSIQAHPTLEQARAGFAAEEAAGVPRDAPHRNYRDDNHKPEMIVALTPFAALCGFRRTEDSSATFERLSAHMREHADGEVTEAAAEVRRLHLLLAEADLAGAFEALLTPGSVFRRGGTAEVVSVIEALPDLEALEPELATALQISRVHPDDPGVLVALLLNRVDLVPGQAIHLPAGNVHAYLHGLGVEVMASSDNVLRGGLTAKHVDVPELEKVVAFEPLPVPYTNPEQVAEGHVLFRPPFEEFRLHQVSPDGRTVPVEANGPAIAVATRSSVEVSCGDEAVVLGPGQAVFVSADETTGRPLRVRAAEDGDAMAHIATVG